MGQYKLKSNRINTPFDGKSVVVDASWFAIVQDAVLMAATAPIQERVHLLSWVSTECEAVLSKVKVGA